VIFGDHAFYRGRHFLRDLEFGFAIRQDEVREPYHKLRAGKWVIQARRALLFSTNASSLDSFSQVLENFIHHLRLGAE
jgi:hypothetical protein